MAYEIAISECQRQIIMQALTHLGADNTELETLKSKPGDIAQGGYHTAAEELIAMIEMFGTLDIDEAASPGCLHGFCL